MSAALFSPNPQGRILALGELLMDLLPAEKGMRLEDTGMVIKTISGSAGIFACAAAKLGAPSGLIARVGRDALSRMATNALQAEGVATDCLTVAEEGQLGLAFLEYTKAGRRYQYYRKDSVGSRLCREDVPAACVQSAYAVHFPGMLLYTSATMAEACYQLLKLAGGAGVPVSFDPNLRLELAGLQPQMLQVVAQASILTPTLAEARILTGRQAPSEVLRALRDLGPKIIALTRDREGSILSYDHRVFVMPAVPVEEIDPTGAGDTFAAALCVGLRRNLSPECLIAFANTAGALAVTRQGTIGMALPEFNQVSACMKEHLHLVRECTLDELDRMEGNT